MKNFSILKQFFMPNIQQIVKEIKKSLSSFDLIRAINNSDNEAKTRMYLVEPFFKILGFSPGFENGNLTPEFGADYANLKGKRADYAIMFKNKPEILIEVKKPTVKLSEKNLAQLNEYFNNTLDAKIAILTNGVEYRFFCRSDFGGVGLNPNYFFSFNWENIEGSNLEKLAEFYGPSIEINNILAYAQGKFFLDGFEEALYKELSKPSRELVKAIFVHMKGKKLTENIENQIKKLINSISLKSVIDKLQIKEANEKNSGIITTEDELKTFQQIKTILAQHKLIDSKSINYRDFKGKLSVILDDNQKKKICDLYISNKTKKIDIDGDFFDISELDDLIKLKKKLTDKALSLLKD